MSIYARRRTIRFSGKQVTISAALKGGMLGAHKKHTFHVSRIKSISNIPPKTFGKGKLSFTLEGASTDAVANPASGGDKLDMNSFVYGGGDTKRIAKLVVDIKKAMGK